MQRISHFLLRPLMFTLFCWGVFLPECHAVSFTVTVDTTALASQPAPPAPFALEFQLNDGDSTVNNTVTLSSFDFGVGGSPTGSAATTGGASGDLATSVILTDSDLFNQFIQGFTPSATSPLTFLLTLSGNVEPFTPDSFSLAIFDSSGVGIPTSFLDVFLQIDITAPLTITTYASDASQSPPGCVTCSPMSLAAPILEPAGTVVPEPGSLLLLASGLGLLILTPALGARSQEVRRNSMVTAKGGA
jgi:hypothetical protein